MLIGLVAAGAAVFGVPGLASADPDPAPSVNTYAPVKPSEYALQNGELYGFTVPGDITCVMVRGSGTYGCSGPIPAAPNGANVVTGAQQGPPGFANADRPLYLFDTPPKPLPAGSKISFRNVTCGTDGTATTCVNNYDGAGFVISPAASFVLDGDNPLQSRPRSSSPYSN
jgi:hypothetical protein